MHMRIYKKKQTDYISENVINSFYNNMNKTKNKKKSYFKWGKYHIHFHDTKRQHDEEETSQLMIFFIDPLCVNY